MGTCDVIPGISGGTIAFITGIYMNLIGSIRNINIKNIKLLLTLLIKGNIKDLNSEIKNLGFYFLLVLFAGVFSAIFTLSKLIVFLLDTYQTYTLAFFVGLIFASSKIIYDEIESHKTIDFVWCILGFILGFSMIFLTEQNISSPTHIYILLSGFLAVSALFLPGISGSFILLILGTYKFILNALHNLKEQFSYIIAFGIGAIIGAFFISHIIDFAYKKDKSKTLYILLGLVLGALFVPIKQIMMLSHNPNPVSTIMLICFVILGVLIITLINLLSGK